MKHSIKSGIGIYRLTEQGVDYRDDQEVIDQLLRRKQICLLVPLKNKQAVLGSIEIYNKIIEIARLKPSIILQQSSKFLNTARDAGLEANKLPEFNIDQYNTQYVWMNPSVVTDLSSLFRSRPEGLSTYVADYNFHEHCVLVHEDQLSVSQRLLMYFALFGYRTTRAPTQVSYVPTTDDQIKDITSKIYNVGKDDPFLGLTEV